ncbi:unnamed protein product [Ixodes hexagonus]
MKVKQGEEHATARMPKRFCCTAANCLSREGHPKPFSSRKLLTQHYIKVHAEKKYACSKCGKKFGVEWLTKHHESTCGTSWHCQCGATYRNREALLTHARRQMHALPFELKRGDVCKRKQASSQAAQQIIVPAAAQVIIVIQDLNVNSGQKSHEVPVHGASRTTAQWRSIVPKVSSVPTTMPFPGLPSLPSAMAPESLSSGSCMLEGKVHQASQTNVSCKSKRTKDSCIQASSTTSCTRDASELVDLPPKTCRRHRAMKTAVETQTSGLDTQCKGSKPTVSQSGSSRKKASYGCSIETQTIESAVCKAKKTRAKRVTSKQPPKLDKEISANELWSDLDNLLFHGSPAPSREWMELFPRNSSATQTLEPDDLFKDLGNSFRPVSAQSVDPMFAKTLQGSRECFGEQAHGPTALEQDFDVMCRKSPTLPLLTSSHRSQVEGSLEDALNSVSHILSCETQTDSLLDSLLMTSVQQSAAQTDFPLFSHNETQTNEDSPFESTDMFHTETQTSGFLFCDFECVDIETQTPWDHFDFSLDDLGTETTFTKKRDAESQIEHCQLDSFWPTSKVASRGSPRDCSNMETQTYEILQ